VEEEDVPADDPEVEAVVVSGSEIKEKLLTPADWDAVLTKPQVRGVPDTAAAVTRYVRGARALAREGMCGPGLSGVCVRHRGRGSAQVTVPFHPIDRLDKL
jgi:hypothetical protein